MTDLPLAPKKANEKLRPVEANKQPGKLSEKERDDLFARYSLDELVGHFGRWPTYYLILRKLGVGRQGLFIGAGVATALVSIALAYLKH